LPDASCLSSSRSFSLRSFSRRNFSLVVRNFAWASRSSSRSHCNYNNKGHITIMFWSKSISHEVLLHSKVLPLPNLQPVHHKYFVNNVIILNYFLCRYTVSYVIVVFLEKMYSAKVHKTKKFLKICQCCSYTKLCESLMMHASIKTWPTRCLASCQHGMKCIYDSV
jgi:hypothetical protein